MRVGQWALAVGRTFEAEQPNVSVGIVSALNRIWSKAIQTDAKVSPNNYGGPLVDISGRVLGVLVPMSPDGSEEVAGVEWYDSGIGFAIPLEDVLHVLPKLEQGQDLRAGVLGVNLKGRGMYRLARRDCAGPGEGAGVQSWISSRRQDRRGRGAADRSRPAELKHALGPIYAGETVRVVAERGEAAHRPRSRAGRRDRALRIAVSRAFCRCGWPMPTGRRGRGALRLSRQSGTSRRIKPGDRILAVAGQTDENRRRDSAEALLPLAPGESVKLEVGRGEQTLLLEAHWHDCPRACRANCRRLTALGCRQRPSVRRWA